MPELEITVLVAVGCGGVKTAVYTASDLTRRKEFLDGLNLGDKVKIQYTILKDGGEEVAETTARTEA